MEIHRKPEFLLAMAALFTAASANSVFPAEKIQITGSTSIQLPKPNEVLENSRKSRSFDGPSGRSTYEGSMIPQGPALLPSNPQADKKFKEALDKKKNWIFVNPYESQYDSKTQEFLKGEKGTALYNHPLMKDDDKGVVQRFLEEKKHDREFEGERADSNTRTEHDHESEPKELRGNAGSELVPGEKQSNPNLNRGLILGSPLEQKSVFLQERNSFQERLEKNPLSESIFGSDSKPAERSVFTREERAARDAELSKIYQPRVPGYESSTSVPGGVDPLNTFDVTRQEATPFSGRRTDQLFNVGRSEPSNVGGGRNSPIFTGPAIGASGSGLNSRLPDRGGFDLNAKAPQASVFAPNVSPASAASSGILTKPAPFVLPIPQRKF